MALTYKKAGVDIKKADKFVKGLKPLIKKTGAKSGIGTFGGFFEFAAKKYKNPVFVSSTDGVGTKLKLAFLAGKHDTVGIDLVAMNVNDVLCSGARPLFFLDYIATGKLDTSVLTNVVKGIANGCMQAGCALVGGETAEMPAFYKTGEYDLAGFCVGVVEKDKIIDGSGTKTGDAVIGIESSGLHSNGYSLARNVFSKSELKYFSRELLKPTRIYVKPVLSLLTAYGLGLTAIKGIAHITGGAFYGKIPRIIPKDKAFLIYKNSWPVPRIFRLMQKKGNIPEKEMYSCFNMGIGMVIAADAAKAQAIIKKLAQSKMRSWIIGTVIRGTGDIKLV
ncbi:MAG: phosphoribosylformylglycinamidine cyclo-ligase [Candidatus Omnitrophica bacterium]|nr:phosphoribosylformylglycinamidine cyclo-ligase [Candidatus Omnitrophota bacterium]